MSVISRISMVTQLRSHKPNDKWSSKRTWSTITWPIGCVREFEQVRFDFGMTWLILLKRFHQKTCHGMQMVCHKHRNASFSWQGKKNSEFKCPQSERIASERNNKHICNIFPHFWFFFAGKWALCSLIFFFPHSIWK